MQDYWYRINSMEWLRVEGETRYYLGEDDRFVPGNTYEVVIYLHAKENYTFSEGATARMNGVTATVVPQNTKYLAVTYQFTCQPKEISTVMVYLDAPVAGQHPDVTPTAAYPELYQPDANYAFGGIYWYDEEGNMLTDEDVFEQGRQYKVEIKLIPAKISNVNVSKFVSPVRAYINGEEVTERFDWDAVYSSNNSVYVYYTFFEGAAAPEVGANVSGFVQADFGTVKPSAALYSTNDTEHTNPLYTADIGSAVKNGDRFDWAFTISGVPAGTYDLVITKDGHQNSVQQITVSSTNKNVGVIDLSVLATSTWSGDSCTVTLEVFEEGVSVMVASYKNGKLEKVEYLTVEDPTAILTGDNVKVFFLDDETYAPIRKAMEMIKA